MTSFSSKMSHTEIKRSKMNFLTKSTVEYDIQWEVQLTDTPYQLTDTLYGRPYRFEKRFD